MPMVNCGIVIAPHLGDAGVRVRVRVSDRAAPVAVEVLEALLDAHAAPDRGLLQPEHDLRRTLAEGRLDDARHVVVGRGAARLHVQQGALHLGEMQGRCREM